MQRKIKRLLLLMIIALSFVSLTFSVFAVDETEIAKNTADNTTKTESKEDTNDKEWIQEFVIISEEDMMSKFDKHSVEHSTLNTSSGDLYIVLDNNEKYRVKDASTEFNNYLKLSGVEIKLINLGDDSEDSGDNFFTQIFWVMVIMIPVGIAVYFTYSRKKEAVPASRISVGADSTTVDIPSVKFSDVEGIDELMSDITRIVDCLKNPDKYNAIGARIPKGIILYGPPGTGKTLIAKAIAGEAGVPFFSMVGSDFVEKYVGVGASRVRDLYKKARKAAPCIVFIDEIDAVASQRGRDDNSERDQTINALLAELDGFNGTENIITICATNRLDTLDSAFQRAGRFDLKLAVGLPDKKSRTRILKIHSKNKKLDESINLDTIANKTVGFSGADLEALMNESALIAVGKNKKKIDYSDVDDAFFKIVMQGNKKRREKITETNRIVAWHEAGHTLATKMLTDDSVPSVTIIGSSSGAGGVTFRTPSDENVLHSKKYLEKLIMVMYAGRAAEEVYFGDTDCITTGASQDIKQASSIIHDYISFYGMGKLGMLDLSQFQHDLSDVVEEASDIALRLYREVLQLLKDNYLTLKELAEALLEKETLDESEIDFIISENSINNR